VTSTAGLRAATLGPSLDLFGVNVVPTAFRAAVDSLLAVPGTGARVRVHFCNVHTLVSAQNDTRLREVLAPPAIVLPDGMPLVWLAKAEGRRGERVSGPDVMESIIDEGRARGYRHFLYGGEAGVPEELAAQLQASFPGVRIVGTWSPPFRPLTVEEEQRVVTMINAAAPDYLWVGLGSPKQEYWLHDLRERLTVPVMLAVGAAFNFHSGRLRRAPLWMRRAGLEWLFRLSQEPRRLWRRYVATNARFAVMVAGRWLRRRPVGKHA
jgi:N-acetylglucosaminyldiphosphoundecaprenol N-acetyl-beta-D-mannosaminyltransferase